MKRPGRKPYGRTKKQQQVIHKIKFMLRKRRDGSKSTYTAIAEHLNNESIKAPGGGLWTGQSVMIMSKRKPTAEKEQIKKSTLLSNDYLTKEQIGAVLRACGTRDKLIVQTLLGTGLPPANT
jgi:hypothetical protein